MFCRDTPRYSFSNKALPTQERDEELLSVHFCNNFLDFLAAHRKSP